MAVNPKGLSVEIESWVERARKEIAILPLPIKYYKYNKYQRAFMKYVAMPLMCMPCLTFSTMFRCMCCLPTCGESIGGSCYGSYVTRSSDDCIGATIQVANTEEAQDVDLSKHLDVPEARKIVWTVLTEALDKMDKVESPSEKYIISEWLNKQVRTFKLDIPPIVAFTNMRACMSAAIN